MARTKALAALIPILLAACHRSPRIVVGSKNFTEQNIVGEILAQQIERKLHVAVERRLNLGGTLLAHEALAQGQIDLYPEYTGTALSAVLKLPPRKDPDAVLREVSAAYHSRWSLTWLAPLGFNNTFAMAIRGQTARRNQFATLSDAAHFGAGWRIGMGYEFLQRSDGFAGLVQAYHLPVQGNPVTMDLGLLYQALMNGQVDMVAGNSTDGMLSALDVVVLRDDKHYFPPYDCAVVVRDEALARFPALRPALAELSGKLSDATMRRLNHEVDGRHRPAREVAAEFLSSL